MLSRLQYYTSSLPTILTGFRNWPVLLRCLLPGSSAKVFTVELRKQKLRFRLRTALDAWVLKEACLDDDYRLADLRSVASPVIVDIGAGIGDFSIWAARLFPQGTIYALEPIPFSFSLLDENIRINKQQNVRAFPLAIFKQSGTRAFHAPGAEAVQYGAHGDAARPASQISVNGRSLEAFFAENGIDRCDFLKMDCEGGEYEILLNAGPQLLGRINRISLEYHEGLTPFTRHDLSAHLRANDFQVEMRPNPAHADLGLLFARKAERE